MTGEVSVEQSAPVQEEIMSNFEEKLNGLIRQIDAYLEVQRDQSLLTSERSSNFMQLHSTGKQVKRGPGLPFHLN